MEVTISRSTRPGKKYQATANSRNGRTVHFGAEGYSDYTKHRDKERRERYIKRHKKNEDWSRSNLMSAGFLARHVLWEEPTVRGAVEKLNKKYKDVKFVLK
jgi:hypothetical protein